MRVTVLTGGASDERDVSLASGCEVAVALRTAGHSVVVFDTAGGVLSPEEERRIREEGVAPTPPAGGVIDRLMAGDLDFLRNDPAAGSADVFFIAMHGGAGEDGGLQALLDTTGIPYTGSDRVGCCLAMDKDLSKRLMRDAAVPTADWLLDEADGGRVGERLGWPVVVKAANGGSSLRLELVRSREEWPEAHARSLDFGDRVVTEAFVQGREFTVGVLGGEALPVGEIVSEHELFDYTCKYQPGMAAEIFPADIQPGLAGRLQRMALVVHDLLRLRDYSRVDFIVDAEGGVWCLEANALPGMTAQSLLPRAAAAAGLSFADLCHRIVALAAGRREV